MTNGGKEKQGSARRKQDSAVVTPRQIEILRLIRDCRVKHGYSPTLQEIGEKLQLSKVTVFEHVESLVRKRLLRREANRARSLRIEKGLDWQGQEREGAGRETEAEGGDGGARYPLCGTVAAGQPVEAIETGDSLDLGSLFSRGEGTYALRVRGESMIGEQIRDGDYVLVEKGATAREGQMVVAVLENGEATLKRMYREGQGFRLEGANPSFAAIHTEKLEIRGVVVGVVRRY